MLRKRIHLANNWKKILLLCDLERVHEQEKVVYYAVGSGERTGHLRLRAAVLGG